LEFLFGGFRRPPPPRQALPNPPDEVFGSRFGRGRRPSEDSVRSASGPHNGYCVRLCDGHYFPIQGRRNASTAEQCRSFCPAAETKVFSGGGIDHAVASDGKRYTDLPTAFAYRKNLDPGCTCNGKTPWGLAKVPVGDDPTLRHGDIVATNEGFTVYNGRDRERESSFTPIDSAKVSKSVRNQLADVKITQSATAAASPERTSSIEREARRVSAREQ
jgi:hypothetical protein